MEQREVRRDRSYRAAARKRRVDLAQHRGPRYPRFPAKPLDCVCAGSVWVFDKRPLGCGCRKRKRGAPKVAPHMCKSREHILAARREWRTEKVRLMREQTKWT